jgi:hypothetical protein
MVRVWIRETSRSSKWMASEMSNPYTCFYNYWYEVIIALSCPPCEMRGQMTQAILQWVYPAPHVIPVMPEGIHSWTPWKSLSQSHHFTH